MAFTDTINAIPFRPTTQTGSGFLPPIGRASVHIGHLLGSVADEDVPVSDDDAIGELTSALEHWHARAATEAISTATLTLADNIETAITEAITEYRDWDEEHKTQNLRNLGHRVAQFWANLDRECIGLRDSDPGSQV